MLHTPTHRILQIFFTFLLVIHCCVWSLPAAKDSLLLSASEEDVFSKFEDLSDELDAEEEIRTPKSENTKYTSWNKLVDVDASYPDNTDVFSAGKPPLAPAFHEDVSMGSSATVHSGESTATLINSTKTIVAAGTLDEFVTGKLGASETGATLPYFLTEPESVYVVKNRPAILKCKAAHALQVQLLLLLYSYMRIFTFQVNLFLNVSVSYFRLFVFNYAAAF